MEISTPKSAVFVLVNDAQFDKGGIFDELYPGREIDNIL
jgi:hypothetical protein